MKMFNPPHPGEIIKGLWLNPLGVTITEAAQAMGVSRKTLSKIVNGNGACDAGNRPSSVYRAGSSAESRPGHQATYDLWELEQRRDTMRAVPLFAVRLSQAAQCATLLAPPRPPGSSYAMPFGAAKPAWRPNTRACHQTPTRARRPDCPLTFDVSRLTFHFPTGATHDTQYHPRPRLDRP